MHVYMSFMLYTCMHVIHEVVFMHIIHDVYIIMHVIHDVYIHVYMSFVHVYVMMYTCIKLL